MRWIARAMPELPEVETTCRGISPHLTGVIISEVTVRRRDLRLPVPECLGGIEGLSFTGVRRRAKYLLLETSGPGTVLVHLGMSGSLRIIDPAEDWKQHDHIGITLESGRQLRFHDPRRFGLVLLLADPFSHPLLRDLGPEPLGEGFSALLLRQAFASRSSPVKTTIMDNHVVVGVGNIYASEALFRAGIRPQTAARRISLPRLENLASAIRTVLTEAIAAGGTTLRDFLNSDGSPGYFRQRLNVYGRAGQPCHRCGTPIRQAVLGQRASYWCPKCQH